MGDHHPRDSPGILLRERERLRALDWEARLRRFEERELRESEEDVDDTSREIVNSSAVHRLRNLRRRIRIGIQNVANRNIARRGRDDVVLAPNPPQQSAPDEPPQCRICLSSSNDENSELGKLFAPCLCKGSVGLVHRKCLDRWRTFSSNPKSHFECDQCKYQYKLQRTEYAKWLEREELAPVCATIATFIIAMSVGLALRLCSRFLFKIGTYFGAIFPSIANWMRRYRKFFFVENIFYFAVDWQPPWHQQRLRLNDLRNKRALSRFFSWSRLVSRWPTIPLKLDILVGGIFVLGFFMFLWHNVSRLRRDFRNHAERIGPSILFLFADTGGRGLRIPILVGLLYSFVMNYEIANKKCKELLMKFGEIVLAVHREE